MQKMKRGFLLTLLFIVSLTIFGCTKANNDVNEPSDELQIFNADLKLTQDQVLSKIKADKIKENGGYKDNDEIIVMVSLEKEALIDTYLNQFSSRYSDVSEYAESSTGQAQIAKIEKEQNNLISQLKSNGLILDVENSYQTIINAIAVKIKYKNLEKISKLNNVSNVIISETYNKPQSTTSSSYNVVENVVDVYETGIYKSDSVSFTGKGTSVAILDSGFDCSHEVFNRQLSSDEIVITEKSISSILNDTNAKKTTKDLDLLDVYYSNKIPFVYDYADKDHDVFPYDSEHGTHVAGIIGGNSDTITGVAIDTQLVLLKVFPDLDDGASTDDILAALEDAVLLGVDCINLSLGSSCGFSREVDEVEINRVYDKIEESGISLLAAASNNYSSAFGGSQGNTNLVTNPDSATVGSPSTYASALSVASISGVKSKYLIANDSDVIFFTESNSINAEQGDFFKELYAYLGKNTSEDLELEYVTIPGVGKRVNYSGIDVKGKIALVRRGDNSFEDKALQAKNAGAVACIIYNNIEGDIVMSMGKTDHVPTISISKSYGTKLAAQASGTLKISYNNQAGPFMSDFSSWGPTPDLKLKPEITAHGGNIKSSVPGGKYDELSGTSMATPNLCGVMVLIRQFLKEKYPTKTAKEISVLANQYMMSTASIVLNEEGNPYSPRKQGAGLASLYNAVNTNAYLTVDDNEKTKLELFDDKTRSGIYEMEFNVVNTSDKTLKYTLSLIGMTESVSTSDETHVREMAQLLDGKATFTIKENGTISDNVLTVQPNQTAKIKVRYVLTEEDKAMIDKLFPYGMFVEGYVKLENNEKDGIDLNIPFLAFYGDWLEAPLFDKTYYEVESEAHDASINEEDKIKADYYATTPYGSYYYNYIIPLGSYLYDIDTNLYDEIPASKDKIAISDTLGSIDGISAVYGGLLRNAKEMHYTITDKVTGKVVWDYTDYNANKANSYGGDPVPYYDYIKLKSKSLGLVNNRQYEFKMVGSIDYGDGGLDKNVRNTFGFDFYLDNEAPVLKKVTYEKIYDKTLKKDRYYINMTVYDNQYTMSITPVIFTSSSSYSFLSENPIPVYSERNSDTTVRFEITDYLDQIYNDSLITSALAFSIDDYALNSNIYLCQLPGTKGDFKFTKDGTTEGTDLMILSVNEGEAIDLTKYLATADSTVDEDKDYLSHLSWTSSNEKVVEVQKGIIKGVKAGKATITVREAMDLKQAVLIVNVTENKKSKDNVISSDVSSEKIKDIKFSYFDTLFAYSRAAQTSEIGDTGSRTFITEVNQEISFYPGEKIQLAYDFNPWYAEDNYELSYASSNPLVATVDSDGVVTGLKEGSTYITLSVAGSTLMARVRITIKSEFVIENRTLVAYKGLGGEVVIPDDEGILYIGAYAFCLYDTDRSIELTDDDYDANKIPSMNTSVTSVVVPEGVEDIQKFAFYNCTNLRKVVLPKTVKYIREYAFCKDAELEEINIEDAYVIGTSAFNGCESLKAIDLSKVYAIGANAFEDCISLKTVDLSELRNSGKEMFLNCTGLESVVLNEHTKLSETMFAKSGLKSIDIYATSSIPKFAFANCEKLTTVNIHNNLYSIGYGAFTGCSSLTQVNIIGTLSLIDEQSFYDCESLSSFTFPNNDITIGEYAFFSCTGLKELIFNSDTNILDILGSAFRDTTIENIVINNNDNYYYDAVNGFLTNKEQDTIILAIGNKDYGDLVIDSKYKTISAGAFTGAKVNSITFTNKDTVIEDYAFKNLESLKTVTFPTEKGTIIGKYAFNGCKGIETVNNLTSAVSIGDYAFSQTLFKSVVLGDNVTVGEGAFFNTGLVEVTLGANSTFGLGAFQKNTSLKKVTMPEAGNVHFGVACFANCTLLSNIDLSKTDSVIEKEAFYGCTYLKTANLLNVKEIGDYAFADCQTLNYINIPIVEKIGEGAFGRYNQYGGAPTISSITLPETLVSLGEGAFLGCEALTEIVIPKSLTTIENYMFAYCTKLEKVTLSKEITSIGQYSFAGCELLSEINLENVNEINDYAFASCVALQNVKFDNLYKVGYGAFASAPITGEIVANKLQEIGSYAFQNAKFTAFTAPSLVKVNEGGFSNCANLLEFVLPETIESLGQYIFNGCTGLKAFYYNDNGTLKETGKINDYAMLDKGIIYVVLASGGYELKAIPGNMRTSTIEVMEGTVRIDSFAANENKHIYKVIFPDKLQLIGDFAFYNCSNLQEVEFRSVTAPTLESTYSQNAKLSEGDPGYELLHSAFDLFSYELCYFTFKDLAGKKDPITMILPNNDNLVGYDSIVYEAFFGPVSQAQKSNYNAMEQNMVNYINYYNELAKVETITLAYEELVNNALTAYNSIKGDFTKFGYGYEEWEEMYNLVMSANETIKELKFHTASTKVKEVQELIDSLPDKFSVDNIELLLSISTRLNALKGDEKALLDLDKYNNMLDSYDDYIESIVEESSPFTNKFNKGGK